MYNKSAFRKKVLKPDFSDFVMMTFMPSRFGIDNADFSADWVREMKTNRSQVSSKTL